jgi:hypothetical protein
MAAKPFRRPLPEHLPREIHTHMPDHEACPDCGGRLRVLGEDVAEMLEHVRACFKVIRHVCPKLSCDACDRIVQAPAPSKPIDRGLQAMGCSPMYWSRSTRLSSVLSTVGDLTPAGGERAAAIYSLIGSAKLNGLDPELYLHQVLERLADQPITKIAELLPWNLAVAKPEDTPK